MLIQYGNKGMITNTKKCITFRTNLLSDFALENHIFIDNLVQETEYLPKQDISNMID